MIGIILIILKLVGLVFTGAFAILGLLTEFKDKETKKITKWGRVALIGIFVSTALSFVSQVLESAKSARDSREATKQAQDQIARSNEVLSNLNRSLNPLTNVRITYWLTAPLQASELTKYRKRLLEGVNEILRAGNERSSLGFISRRGPSGPEAVSIPRTSSLMPQRSETIPFYLLKYSGLQFSFFINHHDESEIVADDEAARPNPDLWFDVSTSTGEAGSTDYSLEYDLKSHQLTIFASDLISDPQFWRSNNRVQAVPDLSGVQLVLKIDDTMVPRLPVNGEQDRTGRTLSGLRSQMQLDSLIFKVNTRELWIKGRDRDMRRVANSGSRPFTTYTTNLPKSVDDLQLH
jgi:hypothetical protein